MKRIETDYLVVGAGAVGMAFVDAMLTESDAHLTILDRRDRAGGHWNDAYPFVRLHQPSAFYGVPSTELGSRRLDEAGSNAGYFELASGPEVVAYFDRVMRERFLPSGRISFLPMTDCRLENAAFGEGPCRVIAETRMGGARTEIVVRRRIVDATYYNTSIPATHERKFRTEPGAVCISPNELPRCAPLHDAFVILGGGKTAMDVGVWLLEMGAPAESIVWVRPRESWLIDRETTQPTQRFFSRSIGGAAAQMEACAAASSVDDLFDRLEAAGVMLRIDTASRPEMVHYATLSRGEAELLRRIGDVRRAGRVLEIGPGRMVFEGGEEAVPSDALFIDCTATAVERRPVRTVFEPGRITLQMVRLPNPTFSAALAAYLEATYTDDASRNALCTPCPLPDSPADWPAATLANMMNQYAWNQDKRLRKWIADCRLDGFGAVVRDADKADPDKAAILERLKNATMPAVANLQRLAGEAAARP